MKKKDGDTNNIPKVFHFPHDIQLIGNGWVIQNLNDYGNSVLPNGLFEWANERLIEKLLKAIIDEDVYVRRTEHGYIAERVI